MMCVQHCLYYQEWRSGRGKLVHWKTGGADAEEHGMDGAHGTEKVCASCTRHKLSDFC